MSANTFNIEIQKVLNSKITSIDFDNVTFGNTFTDHMLICDFKDGAWKTPTIKAYEPFMVEPSMQIFHYGQAIFEGMKAYKDKNQDVWLFRPEQNFERFNKSATRMCMPEVPETVFIDGLKTLLNIDKEWVEYGNGNSLYIRPFMIASGCGVMAQPSNEYRFMIILSPAKPYYTEPVKVIIAEHYSRAANGGIGAAKAAGNYAAQFYPTKLANENGFQQIIWTDDSTHTKLEEAGTMNVFFRINDTLLTAPVSERILDGVTRKSVLAIAERENIKTEVRPVLIDELVSAAENGSLKEIFGAGTAAIISEIKGFSYKDKYYEVQLQNDSYASKIKEILTSIQCKTAEDTFGWTVKV
jgi:branched-chain amino acid aminotransferase